MYLFDVEKVTNELVDWIKDWFDKNGKDCNAIIGISGGKDSTVAAALCVKALGKDRVIGIMMPNHCQSDMDDSIRVCETLGIKHHTVDIGIAVDSLLNNIHIRTDIDKFSEQTLTNLPSRMRMVTLYAISQTYNGRVINTCNLSENICGFSTLYGDHAGDVSLFDELTVTEIKTIGHYLGLPTELVDKAPSDGLTGKTDEENFGFTYDVLDEFIRTGICTDKSAKYKILLRYNSGKFKTSLINFPHYSSDLPNYIAMLNVSNTE